MSDETTMPEAALTNKLRVVYNNEEFLFRIPSMSDKLKILGIAAALRGESDPNGNGIALGYDLTAIMITEKLATFKHLLDSTSAKWVYAPNDKGQFVIDFSKWPDDAPFSEVIDEFNKELANFRANRA